MPCHPEACEESDGELEDESRNVGRESDEAEIENLLVEDEMVKDVIEHPLQNKVHAATSRITEQLEAHHFAERRIEKVDDRGQCSFNPFFYIFQG